MAFGFSSAQAFFLGRQEPFHHRSLAVSSTNALRNSRKLCPFFMKTLKFYPKQSSLLVSAASERDLELTERFFQEATPLETFFKRHSSLFESLEAGRARTVIEAASIHTENTSPAILAMLGSEAFVNQLFNYYPEGSIEVTHFSLKVLADIKEQHDDARCFHINTTDFSEISGSFDAIFLNYFPIFSKSAEKLLRDVARHCKPGGMVVISLAQDKKHLVSLKDQSGGLFKSHLPEKDDLVTMVSALPFELVSYEDTPNFYLATLKFSGADGRRHKADTKHGASIKEAKEYPIYVSGEVVHGFGRGSKKLGFPTANLSVESLPSKVAKLQKGVYYGYAQIIGSGLDFRVHQMVMNIGNRPTFDKDDTLSLEVHILHDYGTDFYGEEMRIAILGFIRKEMQFPSVDDLIKRIQKDIEDMQARLMEADLEVHRTSMFFSSSNAR